MDKKDEIEKKLVKMFEEQQFSNLIRYMLAETFARHTKLSEEEYLKAIGFENSGMDEKRASVVALYNIIIEIMKLKLKNQQIIKSISAVLDLVNKGEENGTK